MTEQEITQAADLHLAGQSWAAISAQVFYHPDFISRAVVARYGPYLRVRRADELARLGVPWPEIARRLGYANRGTAWRSVHAYRRRQAHAGARPR